MNSLNVGMVPHFLTPSFFFSKKKFINILFTFSRWSNRSIVQNNQLWSCQNTSIFASWGAYNIINMSKNWSNCLKLLLHKKIPHKEHYCSSIIIKSDHSILFFIIPDKSGQICEKNIEGDYKQDNPEHN